MDLFLARPMIHAFGAKPRIVTVDVNPTPWYMYAACMWEGNPIRGAATGRPPAGVGTRAAMESFYHAWPSVEGLAASADGPLEQLLHPSRAKPTVTIPLVQEEVTALGIAAGARREPCRTGDFAGVCVGSSPAGSGGIGCGG